MAEANIDIVIDCADPERLADFWAEALHYRKVGGREPYWLLLPADHGHPPVILQRVAEPKMAKTRVHFDIRTPDVEAEAERLERLGAQRLDIGQGSEVEWVVMADPEGNEFCVCPGVPLPGEGATQ